MRLLSDRGGSTGESAVASGSGRADSPRTGFVARRPAERSAYCAAFVPSGPRPGLFPYKCIEQQSAAQLPLRYLGYLPARLRRGLTAHCAHFTDPDGNVWEIHTPTGGR
jgi:hypothetical protein